MFSKLPQRCLHCKQPTGIKVADRKAAQRKEQTGPRVTVAFDPGPSPEPSDSDGGEPTENFRTGDDALGPTAPQSPFNSQKWRTPTTAPWAGMPCTIGASLGLLCLMCAGVSTGKTGCRWSKGTASPSCIKGQAEQHRTLGDWAVPGLVYGLARGRQENQKRLV